MGFGGSCLKIHAYTLLMFRFWKAEPQKRALSGAACCPGRPHHSVLYHFRYEGLLDLSSSYELDLSRTKPLQQGERGDQRAKIIKVYHGTRRIVLNYAEGLNPFFPMLRYGT